MSAADNCGSSPDYAQLTSTNTDNISYFGNVSPTDFIAAETSGAASEVQTYVDQLACAGYTQITGTSLSVAFALSAVCTNANQAVIIDFYQSDNSDLWSVGKGIEIDGTPSTKTGIALSTLSDYLAADPNNYYGLRDPWVQVTWTFSAGSATDPSIKWVTAIPNCN